MLVDLTLPSQEAAAVGRTVVDGERLSHAADAGRRVSLARVPGGEGAKA